MTHTPSEHDSSETNPSGLDAGTPLSPVAAVTPSEAADETVIPFDAIVASSPPQSVGSSGSSSAPANVERVSFPQHLLLTQELVISQHGIAYVVMKSRGNAYAERLASRKVRNVIRAAAQNYGTSVRKGNIDECVDLLTGHAEMEGRQAFVWNRVAPIEGGVEIDVGDPEHTRIRVTARGVETVDSGSPTLFWRPPVMQPMVMPAATGDIKLLERYMNVSDQDFWLIVGWITYTLATPKTDNAKFVILVINGDQGSGKSSLSLLLLRLIDPSAVGVQIFPEKQKDLGVAAANAHVVAYDNLRGFTAAMSDLLCIVATGGAASARALYSDGDQYVLKLLVSLILNGVPSFITQPDLAQRCLPIRTLTLPESKRESDAALAKGLRADLPVIFRGLLDLIAEVFKHLPDAAVTNPERMFDFVRWLAAMELARKVPQGTYQQLYSEALREAQLDSLQENLLASAVLDFAAKHAQPEWSGTPGQLLSELNDLVTTGTQYAREWPRSPISLSKRLKGLKASLGSQGVIVEFARGKERRITITTGEAAV